MITRRLLVAAIACGAIAGAAWALSPMTLIFAVALVPLFRWSSRGLPETEALWLYILLGTAIAARLLVIAGLVFATDPETTIFATFFGDERYLELRSLWVRNLALGIPISGESFVYSGNDLGWTSFITVAAFLQVLIGPAPYGLRLFDLLLFLAGAVALFRAVRARIGREAAFGGLAIMLWMPSLFIWSIALLKEPLYLGLVTATLLLVVYACRPHQWQRRVMALIAAAACILAIETVRAGGATLVSAGVIAGLAFRVLAWNRRVAIVSAVVAPIVAAAMLLVPAVSGRVMDQVKWGANWHRGHVFTPGHAYKTMDERYYVERFYDRPLDSFHGPEAVRFVVRSTVAFLVVPLPWQIETAAERLIIPEQVMLYCLLLFLPIGIAHAAGRDPLLTSVLCGYAAVSVFIVAMTSGNVGTLVRHRALVVPYIVWFGALGAERALAWIVRRAGARSTLGGSLDARTTRA